MSIKIMTAAWAVQLPHADKIVLLALADNANDEGHCFPSISTLSLKCGMEDRSILRVIGRLEELGHVSRHPRSGRSTIYRVNPRLKVTPDVESPLTNGHTTPDQQSPPPLTVRQGTPDRPSPITVTEPSVEPSSNQGEARKRALATRLPADFELTPKRRETAEAERVDPAREFAKFCDHWQAASGVNARKNDWDAAWRNWCRRAADFAPRRNGADPEPTKPKRTWRPPPDDGVPA